MNPLHPLSKGLKESFLSEAMLLKLTFYFYMGSENIESKIGFAETYY
jgi:hypothetical protein